MIAPGLSLSLWKALFGTATLREGDLCACTCAIAELDGSAVSRLLQGQVVAGGTLECLTCLGLMPASTEPAALLSTARAFPSPPNPLCFSCQSFSGALNEGLVQDAPA